ncbi:ATP-binding cassette domain-containing protein [candidate division KSB1 bacterium]
MTENGFMVSIKDLSKRYRDLLALNNISLKIQKGEIFGYIGPNGAGKTTTIKILVGLISEFSGDLTVGGFKMPEERYDVHRVLGYMPQEVAFQEWRTVDHVLNTFGKLSGLTGDVLEKRIVRVLDFVGMNKERHKKVVHLSGGMTQKLGLAQALLHEPELLVLDEPLSGLDPGSRVHLKSIIKELSSEGVTVIFSSHILSDVQDIATKIGIIDHGRILKTGTLNELKSDFKVAEDIEVRLSGGLDKCKNIGEIKGVRNFELIREGVLLFHMNPEQDMDETVDNIIKKLISLDCRIRSITQVEPSLDDVYLKFIEGGQAS